MVSAVAVGKGAVAVGAGAVDVGPLVAVDRDVGVAVSLVHAVTSAVAAKVRINARPGSRLPDFIVLLLVDRGSATLWQVSKNRLNGHILAKYA